MTISPDSQSDGHDELPPFRTAQMIDPRLISEPALLLLFQSSRIITTIILNHDYGAIRRLAEMGVMVVIEQINDNHDPVESTDLSCISIEMGDQISLDLTTLIEGSPLEIQLFWWKPVSPAEESTKPAIQQAELLMEQLWQRDRVTEWASQLSAIVVKAAHTANR